MYAVVAKKKSYAGVNPKRNSIAVRTAELCSRYGPYSHQGRCGQVMGPLSPSVVQAVALKEGAGSVGEGVEPSSEQ